MRRILLLAAALASAPAPAPGPGAAPVLAQSGPSRDWRPEERAVVGDFTRITSVAAAMERVYFTSPTTLLIWHPQLRRWEGPFDPPTRGLLERVFASLADPLDQSLWLARPDGWVHYNPDVQQWESGSAPGVRDIAFDLDQPVSGPFLLTRAGWYSVPRGGFSPVPSPPPSRPLRPTSVEEAVRENPSLQANIASILTTTRLRTARYSAAARSPTRLGWYIGTFGAGALYLPEGAALPERLEWGLPGEVVGAVFAGPGGVWAINHRTAASEAGLTFVASDLGRFESYLGSPAFGLPFDRARRLLGQGKHLWAATDRGVARIPAGGGSVDVIDQGRGLPDDRVYSIVSRRGRLVVGTARGVVRITDSLTVERVARGFADAAYAVALSGDTVWVGTPLGIFYALPDSADLFQPSELRESPSLRAPVVALSWLGDTLVGLTEDRMLWRDPRTRAWNLGPSLSAVVGRLRTFVPWRDGFWIGGQRGTAFARLDTPPIRPLLAPGDTPGEVLDLAVDEDHLWVGTAAGLVRWRLDAIRP